MISERDSRIFAELCEDLEETKLVGTVTKLEVLADAQSDVRLEVLMRSFINQEGDAAEQACEELALYVEAMMYRLQAIMPGIDSDDMQVIVSGVRTRIEGVVYE